MAWYGRMAKLDVEEERRSSKGQSPSSDDGGCGGIIAALISLLIAFGGGGIAHAAQGTADTFARMSAGVGFAIAAGGLGGALFAFRNWRRKWYGASEVAAGLIIAFYIAVDKKLTTMGSVLHSENSLAAILGLASAVYVVVRGLDNIKVGSEEKLKAEEKRTTQARIAALESRREGQEAKHRVVE